MPNIKDESKYNWTLLGKRVKDELKRKGISHAELAAIISNNYHETTSRVNIDNICAGRAFPKNLYSLNVMAHIFDCDTAYLLGEQDCRKHIAADIHAHTGLSEQAIDALHTITNETKEGKSSLHRHIIPLIDRILKNSESLNNISRQLNNLEAYTDFEYSIRQWEPNYNLEGNSADARDTSLFSIYRNIANLALGMMKESADIRYQEIRQREQMNKISHEIADMNVIYPSE